MEILEVYLLDAVAVDYEIYEYQLISADEEKWIFYVLDFNAI